MKKFLYLLLFAGGACFAQKKMLTIEDALVNNRTTLAPENLRQLQFIRGTNDYVYLKKEEGKEKWMKGGFKNEEQELLALTQLNVALRNASFDTAAAMPVSQFSGTEMTFAVKGAKYRYNLVNGQVSKIINKELNSKENLDESSSGYFAYVDNDNLFIEKDGVARQVTNDGSKDIVYASSVHQQEFGIHKGTFWSNNGKLLAFYRMDQTMVPGYPIIDWTKRPAAVNYVKYPMAGDKSHHVTVGVYNTSTQKTTWLNTGVPAEQYLTNIAWSPDDQSVFIAIVNREQNHMKLNEYNSETGAFVRTLFEESDEKYVEPLVPMLFLKNNSGNFIWQSRRDGWNHLYLYDRTGKLARQLTSGQWEVLEVKGFDEKGRQLFFVSTVESPISKNLSVIDLKNFKIKQITRGNYVHNSQVSSSGEYVLDNSSTPRVPRYLQLLEVSSGKDKPLLTAADPLAGYATGKLEIFTLKNKEGQDLYCRMVKPVGFDSTKKYPLVVYWYGGPHAQLVLNSWNGGSGDYWFQYLAERGFVVMSLDTRGSSSRGRAFEQAIFRMAGKPQREDLMVLIDYINAAPYIDKSNMGLSGWSYGGFMTTSFLLENPGIFKAAVAGGPVMDWKYYEIMYTERYMDTPQENPEGYAAANLISKAGQLKDHLLIIHGLQDPVVVQQHSVNFVRAAIDKNVQVDYMIYPGHEHNVLGKDRAHLFQKISDYFIEQLKHKD